MSNGADFRARLKSRVQSVTLAADTAPEDVRAAVLAELEAIEIMPDDTAEGVKARVRARIESMKVNDTMEGNLEELRSAFRDIYAMVMSDSQKEKMASR